MVWLLEIKPEKKIKSQRFTSLNHFLISQRGLATGEALLYAVSNSVLFKNVM